MTKITRTKKKKMDAFRIAGIPYLAIIIGLVVIPMLLIALYAFTVPNADDAIRLSLQNFIAFFQEEGFVVVLLDSVRIALITTIITFLMGYPLAYIIAKQKPRRQAILLLLITAPMWVNMLLRTIAWKQILSIDGPLNMLLALIGIQPINLLGTDVAVVIGMVYVFLPFMVTPIYSILAKMDNSLVEAAQDLGADKKETFLKVIFPLSLAGVLSGVTMVFLPAATTLVIPRYLGEGRYYLIGNLIEQKFLKSGMWNYGSAISLILILVLMTLILFARKFDKQIDED